MMPGTLRKHVYAASAVAQNCIRWRANYAGFNYLGQAVSLPAPAALPKFSLLTVVILKCTRYFKSLIFNNLNP